jgi:hypothetical protein
MSTITKRRVVVATISFEFDEENANEGLDVPLTDLELIAYATSSFVEDVYTMSLHNELHGAVRVTIEERD